MSQRTRRTGRHDEQREGKKMKKDKDIKPQDAIVSSTILKRYNRLDFKLGLVNPIIAKKANVFYFIPLIIIQQEYDRLKSSSFVKQIARHLIFLKAYKLRRRPPFKNLVMDADIIKKCFELFKV